MISRTIARRLARRQSIYRDKLEAFQIPSPPLPEQQRIVGILDEAFAGIATAKANAEKNLQNARALFESHLQSVFTQRGNRAEVWKAPCRGGRVDGRSTGPLAATARPNVIGEGVPVNPIRNYPDRG